MPCLKLFSSCILLNSYTFAQHTEPWWPGHCPHSELTSRCLPHTHELQPFWTAHEDSELSFLPIFVHVILYLESFPFSSFPVHLPLKHSLTLQLSWVALICVPSAFSSRRLTPLCPTCLIVCFLLSLYWERHTRSTCAQELCLVLILFSFLYP